MFDFFIQWTGRLYDRLESFVEKKRVKKILWGLSIFSIFGIIYFLNMLTPLMADDFAYQLIFGTHEKVNSLGDIIDSQVTHYQRWGGRSVVHFIAQVLLQLPECVADVLNSLVYVLFALLIYKHIKGRDKEHSLSLFLIVNLALWFIIPRFGDTVLWITGSANYLWGMVIILLFLLPYRCYDGRKKGKQVLLSIVMLPFGIITGWTNENSVAGMIIMIVLFFLYYRSQKWGIPVAYIVGFVGVIIGYAVMILAPGNFERGGDSVDVGLYIVLHRLASYIQIFFYNFSYFIILFALFVILYRRFSNEKTNYVIHVSMIYVLGAVTAVCVMVFSPQFPTRAWFGVIIYSLIALGVLLYRLNYKEKFLRQMRFALIVVGIITFACGFELISRDIYRMYKMDKERTMLVEEAIEAGKKVCVFELNRPRTDYLHEEDINGNNLLVHHYGIYIEYK